MVSYLKSLFWIVSTFLKTTFNNFLASTETQSMHYQVLHKRSEFMQRKCQLSFLKQQQKKNRANVKKFFSSFTFFSTFNFNCYAEKMFVREMYIWIIFGSGLSDVQTPLYFSGSQHRVQSPLWGPPYDLNILLI